MPGDSHFISCGICNNAVSATSYQLLEYTLVVTRVSLTSDAHCSNAHCLASAALHAVLLGHMCFQPAASSTTVQVHCICHDELHIVLLMQPSIMLIGS